MQWVYYLHTNGELIGKNPIVMEDPQYFDSDFVKKLWVIETDNRQDAWWTVLEAIALGANEKRIKELILKWGLTKEDSFELLKRITRPTELMKIGHMIFVKDYLNMNEEDYWSELKSHLKLKGE